MSNIYCIFSIQAFNLFIHASILFWRFWIIFNIITLNCLSGRLFPPHLFGVVGFFHVPLSAIYFAIFSFCLIYCVWDCLSAGWKVVVSLNYEVCPPPHPPWVGLDKCHMSVSLLGWLVPVFWWMDLKSVSLEGRAMSSSLFWSGWGFGMAFRSLSVNVQSCAPLLLKDRSFLAFWWSLDSVLRWWPLSGL